MSALISPKLGFQRVIAQTQLGATDERLSKEISRSGVEAARRTFRPEFINRIDQIVVFKSLGEPELRRILDLEFAHVQQRVLHSPVEKQFVFNLSHAAKDFLLAEATNVKYGARHLKRAIQRLLVQPLSNLTASDQIHRGDCISVDYEANTELLTFVRETEEDWQVTGPPQCHDAAKASGVQPRKRAAAWRGSQGQYSPGRRAPTACGPVQCEKDI
jgi:ATP-dependent Clp protease ATP-binding subunit ClpA